MGKKQLLPNITKMHLRSFPGGALGSTKIKSCALVHFVTALRVTWSSRHPDCWGSQ